MEINGEEYQEIEQMIRCDDSPVGFDAKKTHIYIIHMLRDIQRRVEVIEQSLGLREIPF